MNLNIWRRSLPRWIRAGSVLAPVRPIVVIQSDDWGRVGAPSSAALSEVRKAGFPVGNSPWDFYGVESADDLYELKVVLERVRDRDGAPACMVANFILANPDLRRMGTTGWQKTHWVELKDGIPSPWIDDGLHDAYRDLINEGVFWPALHGYTHFNDVAWSDALRHPESELGKRVRALAENDIPYLASLTPEFNFALAFRRGNHETFRSTTEQARWVNEGARAFRDMFEVPAFSTCAPGYRSDLVTDHCWSRAGLRVVQTSERCLPYYRSGMLVIPRNVFFEPVLTEEDSVARALDAAEASVGAGLPIVICSHSINYIERHLGRAARGRAGLSSLLDGLMMRFPDLRFAHDKIIYGTYKMRDTRWWRKPTRDEVKSRRTHGFC